MYISFEDSLTWTAQPTNPTEAIAGQDASLSWNYILTSDELTKSQTFLLVRWRKFNPSSSSYDTVASRNKIVNLGATYAEPSAPRIVIDRATGTSFSSLLINDVRIEDGGIYKIEISVEFPGSVILADNEVNFTVSGKYVELYLCRSVSSILLFQAMIILQAVAGCSSSCYLF